MPTSPMYGRALLAVLLAASLATPAFAQRDGRQDRGGGYGYGAREGNRAPAQSRDRPIIGYNPDSTPIYSRYPAPDPATFVHIPDGRIAAPNPGQGGQLNLVYQYQQQANDDGSGGSVWYSFDTLGSGKNLAYWKSPPH